MSNYLLRHAISELAEQNGLDKFTVRSVMRPHTQHTHTHTALRLKISSTKP